MNLPDIKAHNMSIPKIETYKQRLELKKNQNARNSSLLDFRAKKQYSSSLQGPRRENQRKSGG